MQPRVSRGLIAPASDPLGHLPPTSRADRHMRSYSVAVRGRAFKMKRDEMARSGARAGAWSAATVVEVRERTGLVDDNQVDEPAAIELPGRQAAANPLDLPGRPGLVGRVEHPTPWASQQELSGHSVRDHRTRVVDVAVGRCEVEVSVVVEIHESRAETEVIA